MLIETYASDMKNPAVHACQSVFVFKDGCVDRMDTTEQMRMELDRVAKDKEEKRKAKDREAKRKFRAENPEIIKARTKKYYDKNAKLLIAKSKAYYDANPDKVKTREKAHRAANPDKYTAKNKRYWTANADRLKVQHKEYIAKSEDKWKNYQKEYRLANKDQISAKIRAKRVANNAEVNAKEKEWRQNRLKTTGCLECKHWPDTRQGSPHYDNYCFRCFSYKFPHDERVKSRERVELKVRRFLNSNFADFVHDQPIHTAHCVCSHRRRVDHRRLIGNTLFCVETDENFHRYYDPDDEDARYHDLIMAWGGKLCFLRFNPHKFNLQDRNDPGPRLEQRLERLRSEVTRHIGRLERGENTAYLEVHHLYYPEDTPDLYEEQCKPKWL